MSVSVQIQELIDKGMTQELIADKAQIYQSKVSRLATGATKHPRHADVTAINALHDFVVTNDNHWDNYESEVMA